MDLRGVLSGLLSKYVTVAQDEVKVSLWKGQLELHDVQVQVQELRRVLPLNVTHGFVAALSVRVPWTRLLSQSVTVVGSGVRFQVGVVAGEVAAGGATAAGTGPAVATGPAENGAGHQAQEAAAILRQVKRRLKIELSDVLVVLAGAMPGEEVRVHAERLFSGPFGVGADEDGGGDGEEESGDFSRVVRVTGLELRAQGRLVLHGVSAEVVLSFSGTHLSYCNVVFTDELRLSLSDLDVEVLRNTIAALFRGERDGGHGSEPSSAPPTPEIEILAVAPPPPPSPGPGAALAAPSTPSGSWTSAIWNYGKSWLSSAAATPASGISPAKRLPHRPPSSGNLAALEAAAAAAAAASVAAAPPVLPSWFRFELPLFCMEVSRHVEVAVGAAVHMAPRPLLQLRLDRAMVEFSHSSAALELIARLGSVTAVSLWDGGVDAADAPPVLRSEAAELDAVALDWVHRALDRYVEVTVEPFELRPSAALVRELILFCKSFVGGTEHPHEERKNDEEMDEARPDEPPLDTSLSVVVHRPRVFFGEFEVCAEQVRYGDRAVMCDGLAVANGVSGRALLLPVVRLSVDLAEADGVLIEAQGTVGLRLDAPELRHFLVEATAFAGELADELPDYLQRKHNVRNDPQPLEEGAPVLVPRTLSPAPLEQEQRHGRAVEVAVGRLCVHVVAADGAAVADLLVDGLRVRVADGVASGSAAGLILLDRWGPGAGRALAATFAADGEQSLLSARAYAQLADVSFAADVVFASPAYRQARDAAAAGAPPLLFSYAARRPGRDCVPLAVTAASLAGLHVQADVAAWARLAEHARLGVMGLSEGAEASFFRLSAARLKWLFVASKALRWSRREKLLAAPLAMRHGTWAELAARAPRRQVSRLPLWRELCAYLQAAASSVEFELRDVRVALPGGLEAAAGAAGFSRQPSGAGLLPFVLAESRLRCGAVELAWRGRPLGRIAALASVSRVRINGPATTRVELGGASARLDSPEELAQLVAAVTAALPPRGPPDGRESKKHNAALSLACGPVTLSVGDFGAAVGAVTLADEELTGADAALEHRGRRLLSLASLRRAADGTIATIGLRVVVLRDSLEELAAAAQSLRPVGEGAPAAAQLRPALRLLLRDSCFSLPLGRQSALHVSVSRLKGSLGGEMQAKGVCLYFGALQKRDIVVGGSLKIERARVNLAERELDVEVGRVAATLQPETDADHVLYLLQHYELPRAEPASPASAPRWTLRRVRMTEATAAVGVACAVFEGAEFLVGTEWRLSVPAAALSFEGETVAEASQLRVGARQPVCCERVVLSPYLSHFSGMASLVARLVEARNKLRDRGPAVAAVPAPTFGPGHRMPAALQGGSVPDIVVVLRPAPGFDAILQLRCRGLQSSVDDKAGVARFTLAGALGTVADVFSGSEATFFEAEHVFVSVGGAEVHCGTEQPVGITLSLPLMRCVAALRQGRMEPVFPAIVDNLVGWPIIVGGSRRCESGESVGIARGPAAVQVLAGERRWSSATVVDFAAIEGRRVVEVETSDGDTVDLVVSRTGENRFAVAGCTTITNASGVCVQILHSRPFRGLKVLNETVTAGGRALTLSSDKGKEEDEDLGGGDETRGSGPEVVHVMSTPKSAFKFRVAGSKWSEVTVRPTPAEAPRCVLVQCAAGIFLWCSVQSPVSLRLSAICVLQNCLPCALFWASVDGASSGCIESGSQGSFAGHPDNAVFGLSVASLHQAKTLSALVDCNKPRSSVAVSETLSLSVTCFTVSLTRTRHALVSAPVVLCNETAFPLCFGTHMVVAPNSSVPCNEVRYTIGNSDEFFGGFLDGLEMGDDNNEGSSGGAAGEGGPLMRTVAFEEGGRECEVLVSVRHDKATRSLRVEARPWFEVANETRSALAVAQEGLGDVRLEPGARTSLALWMAPERQRPVFRLRDCGAFGARACSEEVWAEFGTVRLVALGEACWVVVRVHFRLGNGASFPRTIRISVHEASPPPFVVRNDSPWPVAVQEQWGADLCCVPSGAQRALFPLFWREYLEQQRESMDEALAALQDPDKGKSAAAGAEAASWRFSFPASVRNKPFVFRVRLEPGGNWSELLESSRPHFFSMPLYSERGSVSVNVAIVFAGLTKQICVGVAAPVAMRPGTSWRLSVGLVSVRAAGLAELLVRGLCASRRGVALEASAAELQVENQVPGAAYPLLLFQTPSRLRRPALVVRARLGAAPGANPLAKLSVALADWGLELDYGSVKQLAAGLAAIFRAASTGEPGVATGVAPQEERAVMDELDFAPFSLLLSWQNPKLLIPVDVWGEMLSIRHLRLAMTGLSHSGCPLSRQDLAELSLGYIKEAFLGQTVRILGSLDVLGNPTGLVVAFGRSVRYLQQTWTAAVEGNGQAVLEGATDAVRTFAGALMTPIVSFSNASARLVGEAGALGAIFDINRRTVEFVSGYFTDTVPPDQTRSPFK